MQRLIAPDVAEGPSAHSFRPASFQIQQSSMRMVTPRGFDTRPPAYVPNSSPSQARFKESTPMSRSPNNTSWTRLGPSIRNILGAGVLLQLLLPVPLPFL
jgi:hypothetical protein